jgi:hypothetical protein
MRRLLFLCSFLAVLLLCGAVWAGTLRRGQGITASWTPTWSENFTGSTSSCGETSQQSWTCTGSSNNLDADASGLGGNFAGHGANFTTTGSQNQSATASLGSAYAQGWIHADIYITSIGGDSSASILRLQDDASGTTFADIKVNKEGATLQLVVYVASGTRDTKNISTGTPYEIDFYISNSAGTWEWYVNDVSEGSGSNDPGFDAAYVRIGPLWLDTINITIDNVQFDTTTRPGSQN